MNFSNGDGSCREGFPDVTKMTKIASALGFCLGLVLLVAVYFNAPGAGPVEAREGASCRMIEVALDEGYGVSRTELRRVCEFAR